MDVIRSNERVLRSPVNWALLGLLIRRPSHGYELMQRFKRAYPETVEITSPSQVYSALDSLARRGLIEPVRRSTGIDPVRQRKLAYRPTPAGLAAYEQWLLEEVRNDWQRSLLIGQHFAGLPLEHALRVLERCAEICLETIGRPATQDSAPLAKRLADEEARLEAGAVLAWLEFVRGELSQDNPSGR